MENNEENEEDEECLGNNKYIWTKIKIPCPKCLITSGISN